MTRHRLSMLLAMPLLVLGFAQRTDAAALTLLWDHSPDGNTAGYRVSYGTQSGSYTTTITAGYVTSVNLANLTEGATYYLMVQSYDGNGILGAPSTELTAQIPRSQPALAVSCPSPVLTSADGRSMPVTISPTTAGGVAPISTTCSPSSGSLFPVGKTSFTCSAVDAIQRKASCTSLVTVLAAPSQPQAPAAPSPALTLKCPTIPTATAPGNKGRTTVTFAGPVVAGGAAPVTVSCTPRSGSQFNVGSTTVTCQATDALRQTATCSTSVTVASAGGKSPKK